MCAKDLRPDINGLARDDRFVIMAGMPRKATPFRPGPRPLFLALLLFFTVPVTAQSPSLKALHVERGPIIDGRLQDEVWKKAEPFTDFRRVFPTEGAPTETTELRVLYDDDNLFLGVFCHDSEPAKICGNTMAHDADDEGENDDNIKVLLDPFLDKRNAYIFFVNACGARSEGLAFGEHSSLNWDGIWDARSRSLEDGWSCEIRIPFKTISFKPDLPHWGINVERYIPRKQETIRLSGVKQDNFFNNAAEASPLEGLLDLKLGTGITFKPYGAARALQNHLQPGGTQYQWDGGFDIYKNFTPSFVGAFSYNTDFAETEVDERRVNLTRFPLYYPEKRTFFLEGSEIFNFGTTSTQSFSPFFSRKIGLYQGNQVPVIFGTKVFGRLGGTNLAFLDVGPIISIRSRRRTYSPAGSTRTSWPKARSAPSLPSEAPRGKEHARRVRRDLPDIALPRQPEPAGRSAGSSITGTAEGGAAPGIRDEGRLPQRPLGYRHGIFLLRGRARPGHRVPAEE